MSGVIGVSRKYVPDPMYNLRTPVSSVIGAGSPSPMQRGSRLADISRNLGRLSQALETLRDIEASPAQPHTPTATYSPVKASASPTVSAYVRRSFGLGSGGAAGYHSTVGLVPGSEERNRALEDAIRQSRERIAALRSMVPAPRSASPPARVAAASAEAAGAVAVEDVGADADAGEELTFEDVATDQAKSKPTPADTERVAELEAQVTALKAKGEKMKDIIRRQQEQVRRTLADQTAAVQALTANHEAKVNRARKEIKRGRERIKTVEGDNSRLAAELEEAKVKVAEQSGELQALLDDSLKEASEGKAHKAGAAAALMRIQALQARAREAASLRKDALRQRDEAISSATQWKEKCTEVEEQLEKLLARLQERQAGLSATKTKLAEITHLRDEAEGAGRKLARENEALRAKVEALSVGLEEQVKKRVAGISELDSAAESAVGWKDRADELEGELAECKQAFDNQKEQCEQYRKRVIELDSDMSEVRRELQAKVQAMAMIDVERSASHTKIEEVKAETMTQLEDAIKARITAIRERDEAVQSAEKWKEEAESLQARLERDSAAMESVVRGRVEAAEENQAAVSSAMEWQKHAEELEADLADAQAEIRALKQSLAVQHVVGSNAAEAAEEIAKTKADLAAATTKIDAMKDRLAEMVQARIAAIKERDEILQEREDAVASAEAWRAHAEDLEAELNDLKSGVQSVSETGTPAPAPPPLVHPVHREFKHGLDFGGADQSFEEFERIAISAGDAETVPVPEPVPEAGAAVAAPASAEGAWDDLFDGDGDDDQTDDDVDVVEVEAFGQDRKQGTGSRSATSEPATGPEPGSGSEATVRTVREGTVYEKTDGQRLGGFHRRRTILKSDELVFYAKPDVESTDVHVKLLTGKLTTDTLVTVPDRAKHPYRFAVVADAGGSDKNKKEERHVLAFDTAGEKAEWLRDIKNVCELAHGSYSLNTLGLANSRQIVDRILASDMKFVNALIDETEVNDLDTIIKPVVRVLLEGEAAARWTGQGEGLLKTVFLIESHIDDEIKSTRKPETLFRTNSRTTKLVRELLLGTASDFMWNMLRDVVEDLMLDDAPEMEVDTNRLPEGINPAVLATNQQNLRDHAMTVAQNLASCVSEIPPAASAAMAYLYDSVRSAFPGFEYPILGGVVFLRFLCPAIIAPHKFGLANPGSPPTDASQRRLMLLAKMVQNMANDVLFGDKEPFMHPLNDAVEEGARLLREGFDEIVRAGQSVNAAIDSNVGVHVSVNEAVKTLNAEEVDALRLHCLRMAIRLPMP